MMSIAMTAPTSVSTPPIDSTSPCVSTARSSVVSLPTRRRRSPMRRWSNSEIGSRSMRADQRAAGAQHHVLAEHLQQEVLEAVAHRADDDHRDQQARQPGERRRSRSTRAITSCTSSGCASAKAAPMNDSAIAPASSPFLGKR